MAFPESLVQQAWNRAGGKSECRRTTHGHSGRCSRTLLWTNRGKETSYGWEAHHITAGGSDTLSNCEILCQDGHEQTRTFGR